METNENENTNIQTLWDAAKAVLRGKYLAIQAYLQKQGWSQIQKLTSLLNELETQQQRKPNVSRSRETKKHRAEINPIEPKTRLHTSINLRDVFFFK